MSDSDKTKEQLIEELKALRSQVGAGKPEATGDADSAGGLTRRDMLSGWVAPVILTVPLMPRTGRAQVQGGDPEADFVAFPTRLYAQADDPQGAPTQFPTQFPTAFPSFQEPSIPTASPSGFPTAQPTTAPTMQPTAQPTASPTVVIPVELTDFEVNG